MNTHEELCKLANASRNAWGELMLMLRLSRVYQTSRAVEACMQDIEHARTDLAKAYEAHRRACAELAIHSMPLRNTEQPSIDRLRKEKGNEGKRKR